MPLNNSEKKTLLEVAKLAIEYGVQTAGRKKLVVDTAKYSPSLQEWRATFVTLELEGALRGCIGTLDARQPLVCDVTSNAHAAAFSDPRFFPVSETELSGIDIYISILSPAEAMQFSSQQNLLAQLRPGMDGLILQDGYNKGTFLPSVWESLPDAKQFLAHLKLKAGLAQDYWSDALRVYRYTTEYFGNEDLADQGTAG